MTPSELRESLRRQPLIVSVQASEGSPVDDTETLLKLAQASTAQGITVLRLEGAERVRRIRQATGCVTIGLIKRRYQDSDVYITPTAAEVDALLDTGCEIVALDGTNRRRPNGEMLAELIERVHRVGKLAMADCDSVDNAVYANICGADLLGTTLAGYTDSRKATDGPDLELVRAIQAAILPEPRPILIAEGRYAQRWQIQTALRIGADAVVVGGAINDPVKTTRSLMPQPVTGSIAAVDIGGTWIRFATFSVDWEILESVRAPLPADPEARLNWIRQQLRHHDVTAVGISSGGVVDPATRAVVSAKEIVPGHVGTRFDFDVPTFALNDGLATAWGHACLPEAAGRRVATLALGTGVGCGIVSEGKILSGSLGDYPRLNDLAFGDSTIEDVLGGEKLGPNTTLDQRRTALHAFRFCVQILRTVLFADVIYVCGGVGLSDLLKDEVESLGLQRSPFGEDAGLYGAAALALFPAEL